MSDLIKKIESLQHRNINRLSLEDSQTIQEIKWAIKDNQSRNDELEARVKELESENFTLEDQLETIRINGDH